MNEPLSANSRPIRYQELCSNRLAKIRRCLLRSGKWSNDDELKPTSYIDNRSHLYVTLFQAEKKRIRWGACRSSFALTMNRILEKLIEHKRFSDFDVDDPGKCRILLEFITCERPVDIRDLHCTTFNENRFEPGITGLKYSLNGVTRYFMPTDSWVESIMSTNQLLNYISKTTRVAQLTRSVQERIAIVKSLKLECYIINSHSEISHNTRSLRLYRGLPIPEAVEPENIEFTLHQSGAWLLANQNADGSHLYFYDARINSQVDFQHPNTSKPPYYNILRHSGASITLLRLYDLTNDQRYLDSALRSIKFFVSTLETHSVNGAVGCYPFFNRKSKLGGAGIGLAALIMYSMRTNSNQFHKEIKGLVTHIRSRITSDGELIGYYRHPSVNSGKPIIDPPDEIREKLFSFYYPGEALLGLALYLQYQRDISTNEYKSLAADCRRCLDFLVHERPKRYPDQFTALPADSWLMQAIEEFVKLGEIASNDHVKFVFDDAKLMCKNMYSSDETPYRDYAGGYYYNFGDHVYQDASRCEGLISAYYLAKYIKQYEVAEYLKPHIQFAVLGLLSTWNSEESSYPHRSPKKAYGTFRFKLTRTWLRVDSVQHAVCFYARFLLADIDLKCEINS